jgi:hypothetical protein
VEDVMALSSSEPTLTEVVREALAELGHQPLNPRVEVRLVAAPAIVRLAVEDVAWLVAELVENAVLFSPHMPRCW